MALKPLQSSHFLPILLTLLQTIQLTIAGDVPQCFYPNGTQAVGDFACYLNTTESFCCGSGYACLANKICLNTDLKRWDRGTCTDKSFQSPECPQFCEDPAAGRLAQCNSQGASCCVLDDVLQNNGNYTQCCGDSAEVFTVSGPTFAFTVINADIDKTLTRSLSVTSSSGNTTITSAFSTTSNSGITGSTSQSSGTNSSTLSSTTPGTTGKSLSDGAKAGIGIGATFGALLLLGFGLFFFRRHSKLNLLGSPEKEVRESSDPTLAELHVAPLELAGDRYSISHELPSGSNL